MIVREFGGPEVIEPAELPVPVAATSVNTVELMICEMSKALPSSLQPPAILGMNFAGT